MLAKQTRCLEIEGRPKIRSWYGEDTTADRSLAIDRETKNKGKNVNISKENL